MANQTGQTGICNAALVLIGTSETISSIDQDVPNATRLKTVWPLAVDATLAEHPWNFAVKRRALQAAGITPEFGWTQAYDLPADTLRWLPWSRTDADWFDGEEEGGRILCDIDGGINIRYIFRQHDLTKWSALFCDALAANLAWQICNGSTQNVGLMDRMEALFDRRISKARRADGLSTGTRLRATNTRNSRWLAARRQSTV